MAKEKFTLRVEADILKDMKKTAIDLNIPVNEMLVMAYLTFTRQDIEQFINAGK